MKIEFFFDFGSPAAYLAWTQLSRLEAAGEVALRPFLLGGVFKATGNASPVVIPAKSKWMNEDLGRWAARYSAPLKFPRGFPLNTIAPMRGAAALEGDPRFTTYVTAVYEAIFGRGEDISDPKVLGGALKAAGLESKPILAQMTDEGVKAKLKATTEEAVARGAFGAPTFYVGDEMHFGNDRIDWVIAAATR
ncbi:MAG: 2-hydroxychromene-2-carboxylate isomerase [Paracoccaceae bacterium]